MAIATDKRERLLRQDPHFRALLDKHRSYDERLDHLRTRRWLSEDEQVEEVRLKKMKLALKDEMEAILRRSDD